MEVPTARPRLTLITLHYQPERTGNAPYASGMAQGLARDFDVQVVTTYPHYPEWRVAPGYAGWRTNETVGGVSVRRLKHYVPANPTGLSRVASELSFTAHSAVARSRPDLVIALTPGLLPLLSAHALGRRRKVPVGVVVQDLYSRAMVELGLLGGRADRPVHLLEGRLLSAATGVVAIHERMAQTMVREFGIDADRLRVIPNWTHVTVPDADRLQTRRRLGWGEETVVVHAGNIGAKQGLEHLVRAARLADAQSSHVRFVLIGGGNQREHLRRLAEGSTHLEFVESVPESDFTNVLSAADALLLHERPGLNEMCVPSKLTSYFAAGRPVIAATSSTSAAAHEVTVSGAGVVVEAGMPEQLLSAAETMAARDVDGMGRRGQTYAQTALSETAAIASYRDWAWSLLSGEPSRNR